MIMGKKKDSSIGDSGIGAKGALPSLPAQK